jgi:predicted ATPase
MPEKLPLIDSIKLKNFLSFGTESMELELKPLNIFIGPNGSGKSNLIEAIGLLRSASKDLTAPIRDGGGISEWLWKGDPQTPIAEIEATVNYLSALIPIRHHIAFTREGQRFKLEDESIENSRPDSTSYKDVQFFYRFRKGRPVMNVCESGDFIERTLQLDDVAFDQSVLSQRKDPDQYPEITYLGNQYAKIKFYREWNLGRYTSPRVPQKPISPMIF